MSQDLKPGDEVWVRVTVEQVWSCGSIAATAAVEGDPNDRSTIYPSITDIRDAGTNPQVTAKTMERASWIARQHPSFNIITSAGRAATQSVDHLHIHVVPRAVDDKLMTPWGTIYGDEPSAPHWCRVAEDLKMQLEKPAATDEI